MRRFTKIPKIEYNDGDFTMEDIHVKDNSQHRAASFIFGLLAGTIISFVVSLLLTPQSGSETRDLLRDQSLTFKDRLSSDREIFSQRLRSATDQWVAQLRETANDMVKRGYLSAEEANAQINALLERVRG